MNLDPSKKTIGIIGAGQLAVMLIPPIRELGFNVVTLGPEGSPAFDSSDSHILAETNDEEATKKLSVISDFVTIEIENVNVSTLYELEKAGKKLAPSSKLIQICQNKAEQKLLFQRLSLPTSNFEIFNQMSDAYNSTWKSGFLKISTGGYDGRGVLNWSSDLKSEDLNWDFSRPGYIEESISIEKELALQVTRNSSGEISISDPVEMVFDSQTNQLDYLLAPASVDESMIQMMVDTGKKLSGELNLVGILAIEFFLTVDGKILVNEMAPRTHNSGHHSIEACHTSQFKQQILAITGQKLGDSSLKSAAAMMNLIGVDKNFCDSEKFQALLKKTNGLLHFYGKKVAKPNRKMGHVNFIDSDPLKALERLKSFKEELKKYV